MKTIMTAAAVMIVLAAPLWAQDRGGPETTGFVTGLGGFASSVGSTTDDLLVEGGVRVAPHMMVFGDVGRFGNLQADLQPILTAATASLASSQGLNVVGGGSLPASYAVGGLRVEIPTRSRVLPYVIGGIGVAHLSPTPQFTFTSGTLPDGSTPAVGTDVTSAVESAGVYAPPQSSNTLMFMTGGGVQYPIVPHWVADVGYRYSRISSNSTLGTSGVNTNGLAFGVGYRF